MCKEEGCWEVCLPQLWCRWAQRAIRETPLQSGPETHDHRGSEDSRHFPFAISAVISRPHWDILCFKGYKYVCLRCNDYAAALTFHSNPPMASPEAAAVPATPTKWPLPMLLAKSDAPICKVQQPFINDAQTEGRYSKLYITDQL